MAGWFPLFAAFAGGFNSKKVQVGPNFFGASGAYEFKNLWLTGQGWGWLDPANYNFDSNGYPRKIVGGTIQNLFYIPTQAQRPGRYVMLWDGQGTMQDPGGTAYTGFTSANLTSGAGTTNNRYEFTPLSAATSLLPGIVSVGSPTSYITNVRVMHYSDEAAVAADPWAFGDLFLAAMKYFGVLRFMNWQATGQGANVSNLSLWDYRKPKTYAFLGASEVRQTIYAGGTSNSGDDYTLLSAWTDPIFGSGGPQDKQTIHVKFNADAVGNTITLTVNGVKKPILRPEGSVHQTGSHTGRPGIGDVHTLVFDAALDGWINYGIQGGSYFMENGVPFELMVKLAQEAGAHPWFNATNQSWMPTQSASGTDLLTGIATYCRDNAPSWMIPRFEGTNETWNSLFNAVFIGGAVQQALSGQLYYNAATPFTVTGVTYSGQTATMTGSGTLPPVGALIQTSNPFGSGLFSSTAANLYVTSTSAGTVHVEYPNDPAKWPSGTFATTGTPATIAPTQAAAYHDWYGACASATFKNIANVYGVAKAGVKSTTKYRTIIGVNTSLGGSASNLDQRMLSRSHILRTGGDPASDWTNAICCAQYITPDEYGSGTETTRATAYSPWVGVATITSGTLTIDTTTLNHLGGYQVGTLSIGSTLFGVGLNGLSIPSGLTITGVTSSTVFTVSSPITVPKQAMRAGKDLTQTTSYIASLGSAAGGAQVSVATVAGWYSQWAVWANGYGVKEMHGYEGGYSPDFVFGGTTVTEQFRHAAGYEPTLGTYTTTNYNNFRGIGTVTYPSGFTGQYPSCFNLIGYINDGYASDPWSVLFDVYEVPDPPQWAAIKAY
jgi:hypothetical protein